MRGQTGFFDVDDRLKRPRDLGDHLEAFTSAVAFKMFRADLMAALGYSDGAANTTRLKILRFARSYSVILGLRSAMAVAALIQNGPLPAAAKGAPFGPCIQPLAGYPKAPRAFSHERLLRVFLDQGDLLKSQPA